MNRLPAGSRGIDREREAPNATVEQRGEELISFAVHRT
jgi:hypothetical protein